MSRFLKPLAQAVIVGVVLSSITCLFPYAFCGDGDGRGLPFAVHHPHAGRWFSFPAPSAGETVFYYDPGAFLLDVGIWAALFLIVGLSLQALSRRLRRLRAGSRRG